MLFQLQRSSKPLQVCFALFLFIGANFPVSAQEAIGLNPPSLKWQQFETGFGKVIFPEGMDSVAFRIASILRYQNTNDSTILGEVAPKNVPVILQNQSTLPAGFATPAPWRNELYLANPQNPFMGPALWTDVLAIHEFRHTQQFDMARGGITLPWKILMGQTGWLLNTLMLQPLWFREGDATYAETIYSKGGRGRLPSFHMEYRALRMAGYDYSYEKAHFYSYRDFIPNPYRLGYYMVNKARKDYGVDVWADILHDTHYRKGVFYPFSRSLKKISGQTTPEFYASTMLELDSIFEHTNAELELTSAEVVTTKSKRTYTNYRYPHFLQDGSVVVLKSGFDEINTYYLIHQDGSEERLFSPGIYTDDHQTAVVEGNLMAWAESGFHERWVNVDYSDIRIHDFSTGKTRTLTRRSRYFMPAPSKDGKSVAVIETTPENRFYLTVLAVSDGSVLRRVPVEDNQFITHIRWIDTESLVGLTISLEGNSIVTVNSQTGAVDVVIGPSAVPFTRPFPRDNFIYYSSGGSGIDNIYAVDMQTGENFQVTSVPFGAYEPVVSADGKKLVFSDYTADGYRTMAMDMDPEQWVRQTGEQVSDIVFHQQSARVEGTDLSDVHVDTTFSVRKFNAWTAGLFNIYGWFPIPSPPEYGLEFYTRNIMSTLRGTLGTTYNTNENNFRYFASLEYAALYPVIDVRFEHARRSDAKLYTETNGPASYEQDWRENSITAGLKFPFRLTRGTHYTNLTIGGYYQKYDVSALDSANTEIVTGEDDFQGWLATLEFSRLRKTARQQVKPRWGQVLNVELQQAVDDSPKRYKAVGFFFFPGVARNHSLNLSLRYKDENVVDTYRYIDDFMMPRGYKPFPFEKISVIGANYEFPIWYPDIAAGSVAFFQRLRGEVFFDYSRGSVESLNQTMNAAGLQLYVDTRIFRLFEMTMAFRFNLTFDDNYPGETTPFEFLITRFELAN